MSQDTSKLGTNDPQLVVLHRHLLLARRYYDLLRVEPRDRDKLRNHRFSTKCLREQIQEACKNSPKWQTGRQQLATLIELRHDLEDYWEEVFGDYRYDIQIRKFGEKHHEFYATLIQALRLFA